MTFPAFLKYAGNTAKNNADLMVQRLEVCASGKLRQTLSHFFRAACTLVRMPGEHACHKVDQRSRQIIAKVAQRLQDLPQLHGAALSLGPPLVFVEAVTRE